jgi:hypothetical protein
MSNELWQMFTFCVLTLASALAIFDQSRYIQRLVDELENTEWLVDELTAELDALTATQKEASRKLHPAYQPKREPLAP